MPIVTIRTNKFMSRELKVKVSEEIKKVIDTIPYEKGEYVITDITDGASMLLGNVSAESPIATVEINIVDAVYKAVDREILEAARLDGAGEFRVFLEIGMPMGTPGILSVCILTFLDSWNMIEQPMTYLKTRTLWPLSLFLPEIGMGDMGVGFAAAFMMLVPALLLFLGCQEYLEQGIAMSGGKD